MPITSSAKKALRVSNRRRTINQQVRSRMRSAIKSFLAQPSEEKLTEAFSRLDRAVKNNLIHRNKAARKKSQLAQKLAK